MKFLKNGVAVLMLAWAAISAAGEITDVDEIVRRANEAAFYQGKDGRAETRMTIVDSQGRKQLRQFTILRRTVEQGGDQDLMVFFSRPADVRGTVFRVAKHVNAEDDRWLYLPGLDLVKRIAAGDKRTSFVGSHFFYEDVSGRNPADDSHELTASTASHYVLRNRPVDAATVEFSEYTLWVRKDNFLPEKAEYLNKSGKPYRRVEALEIEDIDGHATPTKMQVTDLVNGGYTTNEMRFISYDIGLPEDVFSERSLRTPPRQWLSRGP